MKTFLITGGAGFVGSQIALLLKKYHEGIQIYAFDNLKRRGSELNLSRLKKDGVHFIHGDIRNWHDLNMFSHIDTIIDCAAEPSILAGMNEDPRYVIDTNLLGTVNALQLAKKHDANFIFLSTSRVYPYSPFNEIEWDINETRFQYTKNDENIGISSNGINEDFPLNGPKTFYGATKLCSEILFQEYMKTHGIRGLINRCGVITGPWQMGKVDQGFVVLWVAKHYFKEKLLYIGFNGSGKQVRDIIHVEDLFQLMNYQIQHLEHLNGQIFNVGGGLKQSVSLMELTQICEDVTGNKISIQKEKESRMGDIPWYISDIRKICEKTGWKPEKGVLDIVQDIAQWIKKNENELQFIFKSS